MDFTQNKILSSLF